MATASTAANGGLKRKLGVASDAAAAVSTAKKRRLASDPPLSGDDHSLSGTCSTICSHSRRNP